MTAINFDKPIDADNITWLIEQLNIAELPINIYIRSDGGDSNCTPSLIDYINLYHKQKKITLIGFGNISSAAFDIFWLTTCPKRLLPGTWALVHKTKFQTDEAEESSKMIVEQKRVAKQQDEALYTFLKKSKLIPAIDLKNFNIYKDIIIGYEKLQKLLSIG